MATLPEQAGLSAEMKYVEKPTNTFIVDWESKQIAGRDDGLAAMRQAVEQILQTERFRWQIYSSNFGIELEELPGEDYEYIESEIPRRVTEAFSLDKRILSAENFTFIHRGNGALFCIFDVKTVFGGWREEVEV